MKTSFLVFKAKVTDFAVAFVLKNYHSQITMYVHDKFIIIIFALGNLPLQVEEEEEQEGTSAYFKQGTEIIYQ